MHHLAEVSILTQNISTLLTPLQLPWTFLDKKSLYSRQMALPKCVTRANSRRKQKLRCWGTLLCSSLSYHSSLHYKYHFPADLWTKLSQTTSKSEKLVYQFSHLKKPALEPTVHSHDQCQTMLKLLNIALIPISLPFPIFSRTKLWFRKKNSEAFKKEQHDASTHKRRVNFRVSKNMARNKAFSSRISWLI